MRWFGRSAPAAAADAEAVAQRLATLVRIPTIAAADGGAETDDAAAAFGAMRGSLEGFYPQVFAAAQLEVVGRHGLLLRIPGHRATAPVVLMAHQDVVPVPEDWEAEGWEHPPFAGEIADGWVHGRGTLDDKGALVVLLEAVDGLLAEGWEPAQDLYLLLGADEEVYGSCAVEATRLLESRGITPAFVLDEGGAVAVGAFPGVSSPLAVVGVAEKGVVTLELVAEDLGGHASTPPRRSAAGRIAQAIVELEEHPFPAALGDVTVEMFEALAPHAPRPIRSLLGRAGSWHRMAPALLARLGPELAAMVRTTVAVTQLEGSAAHNVLATRARAVVNIRVAVGTTTADAVERVERIIDDEKVTVRVLEASEPSPVSPTGEDPRWLAIRAAVDASYPEAATVPYVMLAASDARHLHRIAPATYRFSPLRMDRAQRAAVHGPNEKVEVESLGRGVAFYRSLLTGPALGPSA